MKRTKSLLSRVLATALAAFVVVWVLPFNSMEISAEDALPPVTETAAQEESGTVTWGAYALAPINQTVEIDGIKVTLFNLYINNKLADSVSSVKNGDLVNFYFEWEIPKGEGQMPTEQTVTFDLKGLYFTDEQGPLNTSVTKDGVTTTIQVGNYYISDEKVTFTFFGAEHFDNGVFFLDQSYIRGICNFGGKINYGADDVDDATGNVVIGETTLGTWTLYANSGDVNALKSSVGSVYSDGNGNYYQDYSVTLTSNGAGHAKIKSVSDTFTSGKLYGLDGVITATATPADSVTGLLSSYSDFSGLAGLVIPTGSTVTLTYRMKVDESVNTTNTIWEYNNRFSVTLDDGDNNDANDIIRTSDAQPKITKGSLYKNGVYDQDTNKITWTVEIYHEGFTGDYANDSTILTSFTDSLTLDGAPAADVCPVLSDILNKQNGVTYDVWNHKYTITYSTDVAENTAGKDMVYKNTVTAEMGGFEFSSEKEVPVYAANPLVKDAVNTEIADDDTMEWKVTFTVPSNITSLVIKDETSGVQHSLDGDITVQNGGTAGIDYTVSGSTVTFTTIPAAGTQIVLTYKTKAATAPQPGNVFYNKAIAVYTQDDETVTKYDDASYSVEDTSINALYKWQHHAAWGTNFSDYSGSQKNKLIWGVKFPIYELTGLDVKQDDVFRIKDSLVNNTGFELTDPVVCHRAHPSIYSVTYDKTTSEFVVTMLETPASNVVVEFNYMLEFKNLEEFLASGTLNFENTVSGKYYDGGTGEGVDIGESTATADITPDKSDLLKKTLSYDKGNDASFTIEVNPDGDDLSSGTTIEIEDTLGARLLLKKDSIKVTDGDGNAISAPVSVSGQTFTVTIPDDKHVIITYDVTIDIDIPPAGYSVDDLGNLGILDQLSNKATIKGTTNDITSDSTSWDLSIQQSGASVIAGDASLTIDKYDLSDTNIKLNAKFKLEPGEFVENNENGTGYDFTVFNNLGYSTREGWLTDDDKTIENLMYDIIYRLTETEAPSGYALDSVPQYIVLLKEGEEITYNGVGKFIPQNVDIKVIYPDKDELIAISNSKTSTTLSKVDKADSSKLAGAKIKLTGTKSNSTAVDFSDTDIEITGADDVTRSASSLAYTTTSDDVVIKGLPAGTYTMQETEAPSGYEVADDVTFTVTAEGKIKVNGVEKASVVMEDTAITTVTKYDVTVIKVDDSTPAENVTGAKLQVIDVNDGNKVVATWTTDGTAKVIKLPEGSYKLVEVVTPEGYVKADDIAFTVEADGTIKVNGIVVTEIKMVDKVFKVDVTVKKTDDSTPAQNVTGAVLQIKQGSTVVDEWTTDGSDHIISLPVGTYTLVEKTTPNGYEKAADIEFTVEADGTIKVNGTAVTEITMVDIKSAPDTYSVTLSKRDVAGNELAGAKITITGTGLHGDVDFTKVKATTGTTVVNGTGTGANGSIVYTSGTVDTIISGLPAGTYTMTETTAPLGYDVTTAVTFTIDDDGNVTSANLVDGKIVMTDTAKKYDVTLSKEDIAGAELAGATIKVTCNSAIVTVDFTTVTVSGGATEVTKETGFVTFKSGATATVLSGLPAGTYTMTETTAPDGYEIAEAVTFTINKDGTITSDNYKNGEVVMTDEIKTNDVTLSKRDVAGNELAGATITITGTGLHGDVDFTKVKAKTGETVVNGTGTGAGGSIVYTSGTVDTIISGLPAGTYTMTETTAPLGYDVTTAVTFTIDDDGNVTSANLVDGEIVMIDNATKYDVTLSKEDIAGAELAGATIEIKCTSSIETVDFTTVTVSGGATEVTKETGFVTFKSGATATVLSGLPAGTYTMTETTAPAGYEIAEAVTFTINKDGTITSDNYKNGEVVMTDEAKLFEVKFSKQTDAGKQLANAEITLTCTASLGPVDFQNNAVTVTGTTSITRYTDQLKFKTNGEEITIGGLPSGTYVMTETVTPGGYFTADPITFVIEPDGNVTINSNPADKIVMVDKAIKVELSKQTLGGTELAGATITVTGANFTSNSITISGGGKVTGKTATTLTYTSGSTPTIISGLPAGTYTMHEVAAPDGYDVATDIEFTVNADGTVTVGGNTVDKVVMIDRAAPVSFSKQDIAGNELEGATITITGTDFTAGGITVSGGGTVTSTDTTSLTYTSGSEPTIISGLPTGNYTMTEDAAPAGYKLTSSISFTINADGKAVLIGSEVSEIVMVDELITVALSKETLGGDELPGAKIEVTAKNGGIDLSDVTVTGGASEASVTADKITFTSGSEAAILNGLPAGTYVMHEETAPLGYDLATDIEFTVNPDGTVTVNGGNVDEVKMVDKITTGRAVLSKRTVAGEELPGATIEITAEAGTVVDFTTVTVSGGAQNVNAEAGKLTFVSGEEPAVLDNLPAGTYKMTETNAPEGYVLTTASIIFTMEADGRVTVDGVEQVPVIMINEAVKHTVKINKIDDSTPAVGVTGAVLKVLDSKGKEAARWTSDGNEHELELEAGEYTLVEETAPTGYEKAADVKFTVTADGKVKVGNNEVTVVEMADKVKTYDAVISKQTVGGAELAGAEITITGAGIIADRVTVTGGATNVVVTDGSIKFKSGSTPAEISGLLAGSYTMSEDAAPAGYKIASSVTFTIDDDGNVTSTGLVDGKIVMVDEAVTGSVSISKKDIAGNELPGAEIIITGTGITAAGVTVNGGKDVTVVDGKITYISTSSPVVIENLPAGTYTMHENAAPAGYEIASDVVFTVENNGTVTVDGETVTEVSMTDKNKLYQVVLSKQTLGGKELAGATITVSGTDFTADSIEIKGGGNVTDITTTSVTYISGNSPMTISGLPAGTYTMHEVSAPDGYLVATDITFTVNNDGTVTVDNEEVDKVVMTDKAVGSVVLSKQKVGGKELAGATITITGTDFTADGIEITGGGNVTETTTTSVTYISGDTPTVISGLPAGTYTMHEDAAPDGYLKASDITFTVEDDGTVKVKGKAVDEVVMVDKAKSSGGGSTDPDDDDDDDDDDDEDGKKPGGSGGTGGSGGIGGGTKPTPKPTPLPDDPDDEDEEKDDDEDVSSEAGITAYEEKMIFNSDSSAGYAALTIAFAALGILIINLRRRMKR